MHCSNTRYSLLYSTRSFIPGCVMYFGPYHWANEAVDKKQSEGSTRRDVVGADVMVEIDQLDRSLTATLRRVTSYPAAV